MPAAIIAGHLDDSGIVIDHRRVASREIPPEDPFSAEERPRIGAVDLPHEDLVIAASAAGEDQR
jgi:hypothetical protein